MFKLNYIVVIVIGIIVAASTRVFSEDAKQAEREAMYRKYLEFSSYVKGGRVEPNWMADGNSFWYVDGTSENTVIWKVDPVTNEKKPFFDADRLRTALANELGDKAPSTELPFDTFTFEDDREQAIVFTVEGKSFHLSLESYRIRPRSAQLDVERSRLLPQWLQRSTSYYNRRSLVPELLAPNARSFARYQDHNLWLRSTLDRPLVQLTQDGNTEYEWDLDGAKWSPNSQKLAARKFNYRNVPKIPIVDWLKPQEEVEWVPFTRANKPVRQTELFLLDITSKKTLRIDTGREHGDHISIHGWLPDGSALLFLKLRRDHKRLDLVRANPGDGSTETILTETRNTNFQNISAGSLSSVFWLLESGDQFLWLSERDGWRHLYLYGIDGTFVTQLTQGAFPVLGLKAVDEEAKWVYFTAHGDRNRPQDIHLYRVSLAGGPIQTLTTATGQHEVRFSPSRDYYLDTHSSVKRPPTVELRSVEGELIQEISKAKIDSLDQLSWTAPEEFVVKAADGETDLYGVLYKPHYFDQRAKYPVIEYIYGATGTTAVPNTFVPSDWAGAVRAQAIAQLGFVVCIVDGGAWDRGKQFSDKAYGNVGRNEIPDHVAALRQVAKTRPYMDLSRVGIRGHSFGGYMAMRALLLAPESYHVGVASSPVVDLYVRNWLGYMGSPESNKTAYEYASNVRLAGRLKGKLLLIHGTADQAVPLSQTMKMVQALIEENRPFDLICLPGEGHGIQRHEYVREATRRYFQEHLKP